MAKKPELPQPVRWDIYRAASKARWIGTVEAADSDTAIEAAAEEFKTDVWRLIAVPRR
jgi:hypothetical protein